MRLQPGNNIPLAGEKQKQEAEEFPNNRYFCHGVYFGLGWYFGISRLHPCPIFFPPAYSKKQPRGRWAKVQTEGNGGSRRRGGSTTMQPVQSASRKAWVLSFFPPFAKNSKTKNTDPTVLEWTECCDIRGWDKHNPSTVWSVIVPKNSRGKERGLEESPGGTKARGPAAIWNVCD